MYRIRIYCRSINALISGYLCTHIQQNPHLTLIRQIKRPHCHRIACAYGEFKWNVYFADDAVLLKRCVCVRLLGILYSTYTNGDSCQIIIIIITSHTRYGVKRSYLTFGPKTSGFCFRQTESHCQCGDGGMFSTRINPKVLSSAQDHHILCSLVN